MTAVRQRKQCKTGKPVPTSFVVVLLSVALLFGQIFPVMAKTTTMWIEICGDSGSYMAEVDLGESEPMSGCVHCEYCTLPVFDSNGMPLLGSETALPLNFLIVGWASLSANLLDNPEQYWSACRGPPLVDVENKMTLTYASFDNETIGSALNVWAAP